MALHFDLCHLTREQENLETMYVRRRFQGLSLEEQRRRQKTMGRSKFVARRSSATSSRPSAIHLTPNRQGRVISPNAFGLQVSSPLN